MRTGPIPHADGRLLRRSRQRVRRHSRRPFERCVQWPAGASDAMVWGRRSASVRRNRIRTVGKRSESREYVFVERECGAGVWGAHTRTGRVNAKRCRRLVRGLWGWVRGRALARGEGRTKSRGSGRGVSGCGGASACMHLSAGRHPRAPRVVMCHTALASAYSRTVQ